MKSDLRKTLRESNQGLTGKQGRVKILVALRVPEPDEVCLDRLRGLGLSINRVVKNKVIGSIPRSRLDALKADSEVAETELSAPLEPHS